MLLGEKIPDLSFPSRIHHLWLQDKKCQLSHIFIIIINNYLEVDLGQILAILFVLKPENPVTSYTLFTIFVQNPWLRHNYSPVLRQQCLPNLSNGEGLMVEALYNMLPVKQVYILSQVRVYSTRYMYYQVCQGLIEPPLSAARCLKIQRQNICY